MASVTSNWITHNLENSCFNPTLTIQVPLHHFIGPLNLSGGLRPRYLSVYIHDSLQNESDRANHRREDFPGVSARTVSQLAGMLQSSNSLVQSFLSIREMTQNQPPATNIQLVIHADRRPSNEHERRYNAPASSEIAAIVVGTDENISIETVLCYIDVGT